MPTLTTNQKIALAVSIPIVGILFYVLLKWRQEDDEDEVGTEDEFVSSADLVSELQIPQCHVGAIIGCGGCVIKQIQKESDTRINLKDDKEESGDELTEEGKPQVRTVVIRGTRERIKRAEVLIKKLIDEQPVLEKVVVEIPELAIGRIIGKGGKTIRQLCRISGAKIKFDQDNETNKLRTCDITGTKTQIECAKQLIDEKIAEDEDFRKKKKRTQEAKNKLTFAHLPVHGDYFAVYVSAMDTPEHFWIQNIVSDAKQLDVLVEEMTQFYGDKCHGKRLTPPKVGDICCATFQHDESWYRSEIVKVIEERNEVQVQYLDFGDSDVVSLSNVKEIREEYCTLPFQAIECYMANVKPAGKNWSQEASEMFEKLSYCAQWKPLMARVVYYDDNGVPCIELIDTNTEEDVNIEKRLVDQGFAIYKNKSSNIGTENNSKTSITQRSEPAVVDKIIAEQKENVLKQMNKEFPSPAFEDASFEMNQSESFEFSSPISSESQNSEKKVVNEPPIASVEHQVVSCADISQLNSMFEMLNMDTTVPGADISEIENMKDDDGRLEHGSSDNRICDQRLKTEEDIEKEHEESEKDLANLVSMNLDENVNSKTPITSAVDVRGNFMEPITVTNVQLSESAHFMPDIPFSSNTEEVNNSSEKPVLKDDLYENKDIPVLSFASDHPITSDPEYYLNKSSETIVKTDTTKQKEDGSVPGYSVDRADGGAIKQDYGLHRADYNLESNQDNNELNRTNNGLDRPDHVLRRSYSEDLTRDDTIPHDGLIKCSSEITVTPRKDNTVQDSKNTQSLGSLSSGTPKGKRLLAANFSQILNQSKQQQSEDDESDDESLYLSAKEDSDSTGFFSAIGSRNNLRNDTDSDVTPSGYLSESEDNSMEIVEDQTRFDTTLLVEKLEQYADGK